MNYKISLDFTFLDWLVSSVNEPVNPEVRIFNNHGVRPSLYCVVKSKDDILTAKNLILEWIKNRKTVTPQL